ncbi:MAG: hypothetical protein GX862_04205, partial [Leucobacter sp.]|nr:hypothetical protein [Leucobacter sp.]
ELHRHRIDYTRFFRALADAARGDQRELRASYTVVDPGEPGPWFERWLAVAPDPDAMDEVNPVYIARNALLDEALDAASAGDLAPVLRMLEAVSSPFTRRPGFERFESAGAPGLRRHVTFCGT